MSNEIKLAGRWVGLDHPCYVIAEIGSNHNCDLATAKKMIDVAKESGCDAVKFQSYTAGGLYSRYAPRSSEMEGRSHSEESLYDLIKRIEMPIEWHAPLKKYCDDNEIAFCSTPFDESMVDVLEEVNVLFYKVASFEIIHYPLLAKIAKTGKPVILSTGNSVMEDVELAVKTLKKNGCKELALLHCVSQYPSESKDSNLKCLDTLRAAFDCVVGLSDHTTDSFSSVVAVSRGASIIEKHITLDKKQFGPDHPFALEPEDLKELVDSIRKTEIILGDGVKRVCECEEENHKIGRRSIVVSRDLKKGETISQEDIVIKRPGLGLHPKRLDQILGKTLVQDILKDQWLTWEHFGLTES